MGLQNTKVPKFRYRQFYCIYQKVNVKSPSFDCFVSRLTYYADKLTYRFHNKYYTYNTNALVTIFQVYTSKT